MTFAELTTLRVGGPVGELTTATSTDELVEAVRCADASRRDVLVLGGGSNLLVGDAGFDGVVVRAASSAIRFGPDNSLTLDAGVVWDEAVRVSLEHGLAGLEALAGIPGSAGGSPVQNVGAYGALVSDVLRSATVYDRQTKTVETWPAARCGFGTHRSSVFKHSRRWVVVEVTFDLSPTPYSQPIAYQALAEELGEPLGAEVPAADVRTAVLSLRRRRGMVLDPTDHDTWSVGSFFLNPVVDEVPAAVLEGPRWPDPAGTKLSAAWLIERAGFPRGYGADVGRGTVSLSSKHTLAVTNRGGATADDVLALAGRIRDGVRERFGITLQPECHLVNCELA